MTPVNVLREFLDEQYRAGPSGVAAFLSDACRIVKVRMRRWKGHRRIDNATVAAAGHELGRDTTTNPSWKLCPKAVAAEFDALGREVQTLLARRALNRRGVSAPDDEDEDGTALVGGGLYAFDAAAWPTVEQELMAYQEKWSAAADRWCGADGYAEIVRLLREQIGEADFEAVKDKIPVQPVLRRKFELRVRRAPIRFVDGDGADAQNDIVEMIEMAVRQPRAAAADAWEVFAAQLVDPATGEPLQPVRNGKVVSRSLKAASVAVAARETKNLARSAGRYLDGALAAARKDLEVELPEEPGPAGVVARNLNADDAFAVRLGKMALTAAVLARDETRMCEGFAAARTR